MEVSSPTSSGTTPLLSPMMRVPAWRPVKCDEPLSGTIFLGGGEGHHLPTSQTRPIEGLVLGLPLAYP